jgi:hypothetical protein
VFIRITADRDCLVTLEEPEDFSRFHVEVVGLEASEVPVQMERLGVGGIVDDEHIAVSIATIKSLAGQRPPSWECSFDRMIDYARSRGWLCDEHHIQAHCVWHPNPGNTTLAPR